MSVKYVLAVANGIEVNVVPLVDACHWIVPVDVVGETVNVAGSLIQINGTDEVIFATPAGG